MDRTETLGVRRLAAAKRRQERNYKGALIGFSVGALLAFAALLIDRMS